MDTEAKVLAQFQQDLLLPRAGVRNYSSASVSYPDTYGYYWSSSPYANASYAYILFFYSSFVEPQRYNYRGDGVSLRCFQNSL